MSPTARRILAWLEDGNTGTVPQIAAALPPMGIDTAYSAVKRLTVAGHAKIVAHGEYKGRRTDIYGASRAIGGPIVAQALRALTPLEQAWRA